ncbi:helix-turn-helix transcriptional regulator [Chitinophaga sp. 2R12]|uniref:Helix-turn-helix transcriptional regulator n=1 Tax=Chitinophaga hostae TaxID=2831022 RepID=A0ABS5IT34_9BACT|nr:helix-turn-helix transcriptional regulator [Chitinophaga hostae]
MAEKGRANKWLAEAVDVNINTVSKWCTNKIQPSVETLFEIAEALDVEARELLVLRKNK